MINRPLGTRRSRSEGNVPFHQNRGAPRHLVNVIVAIVTFDVVHCNVDRCARASRLFPLGAVGRLGPMQKGEAVADSAGAAAPQARNFAGD